LMIRDVHAFFGRFESEEEVPGDLKQEAFFFNLAAPG